MVVLFTLSIFISHCLCFLSLCAICPSCHIIINSHYFPSSVLWLLSVPSCSLVISEWSFGQGRLRRFSIPSEPHLINRAPHCPSEWVGQFTSLSDAIYWRSSERSDNKKEKVWLRCFMFQEPCLKVTYLLAGGRRRLAFCQWQHSVNWIKSTWRPAAL